MEAVSNISATLASLFRTPEVQPQDPGRIPGNGSFADLMPEAEAALTAQQLHRRRPVAADAAARLPQPDPRRDPKGSQADPQDETGNRTDTGREDDARSAPAATDKTAAPDGMPPAEYPPIFDDPIDRDPFGGDMAGDDMAGGSLISLRSDDPAAPSYGGGTGTTVIDVTPVASAAPRGSILASQVTAAIASARPATLERHPSAGPSQAQPGAAGTSATGQTVSVSGKPGAVFASASRTAASVAGGSAARVPAQLPTSPPTLEKSAPSHVTVPASASTSTSTNAATSATTPTKPSQPTNANAPANANAPTSPNAPTSTYAPTRTNAAAAPPATTLQSTPRPNVTTSASPAAPQASVAKPSTAARFEGHRAGQAEVTPRPTIAPARSSTQNLVAPAATSATPTTDRAILPGSAGAEVKPATLEPRTGTVPATDTRGGNPPASGTQGPIAPGQNAPGQNAQGPNVQGPSTQGPSTQGPIAQGPSTQVTGSQGETAVPTQPATRSSTAANIGNPVSARADAGPANESSQVAARPGIDSPSNARFAEATRAYAGTARGAASVTPTLGPDPVVADSPATDSRTSTAEVATSSQRSVQTTSTTDIEAARLLAQATRAYRITTGTATLAPTTVDAAVAGERAESTQAFRDGAAGRTDSRAAVGFAGNAGAQNGTAQSASASTSTWSPVATESAGTASTGTETATDTGSGQAAPTASATSASASASASSDQAGAGSGTASSASSTLAGAAAASAETPTTNTAQRAAAAAAPAATANGSVPNDPALGSDVVRQIRSRYIAGRSELQIQLDPANLGEVRLRIRLVNDQVHIQLDAGEAGTRQLLERHLPELRSSLSRAGVSFDDIRIAGNDTDSSGPRSATTSETTAGEQTGDRGGSASQQDDDRTARHSAEARPGRVRFTLDGPVEERPGRDDADGAASDLASTNMTENESVAGGVDLLV